MRTSQATVPTARAHHLQESLRTQLAKGREWATPGIEAALHRALAGIDSGLEAASPRVQASLRTIADELAGGVESVTPRVHERITRITQKATPPAPDMGAELARGGGRSRKLWLIAGIVAAAALCGATLRRVLRPGPEGPVEPSPGQTPDSGTVPSDPAAASSGI